MADGIDKFFGATVVDNPLVTAAIIQSVAASALIVGTAPVDAVHTDPDDIDAHTNRIVLVNSREDALAAFGPPTVGFTLPEYLDGIFDQAKARGVGTLHVVNVFDPDTHTNGVSDVTAADIIAGLRLGYGAYQRFGYFPKILLAPGWMNETGVASEALVIANRIRGRILHDAPLGTTMQEAIEARGAGGPFDWQSNALRHIALWPHLSIASPYGAGTIFQPYSPRFAGVWLSSIMEFGYQHSPSNRPIYGIEDSEQDVLYIPGDATSDMQELRRAGIVTIEERWGKGEHTSGNRALAYPTNSDFRNYLHVQFIEDMLDEAVIAYLDQWKDRNASPNALETQEERINAHLRGLTIGDNPVLYKGRFWFDREKTRSEDVLNGDFYYKLEYAPVGVFETMTVERGINIDLVTEPLGLVNAG